ncbi:5'-nucleotidase [Myxococcus llanfairpwllgwyngyllgogerychwyrndrobwllllantysiliogogogochensis]|uniref:5'-nucleotidase n=1 Tax=Myxococcus llanfairpwllgwyngyllgogerychwyrndrobwllllantysiliogogogochensis TaxID=2590453 RepID=UPI0015F05836|nr:5'-nucleotidase [Myxococcus llanfairpwllgwyngyllgogerychwyrndrobwllllantysiliogogogochensis]
MLDAGNALFRSRDSGGAPDARARAELLLAQMDAQGTTAMAVGARDLNLGVDFLRKQTRKSKLKLLSANLVDAKGTLLFPASTVVDVGGLKVGVVGASPATTQPEPMEPLAQGKAAGVMRQGLPVAPAVAAEAKRLRQKERVDLVVLLAAVPYDEVLKLANEVEGVDFVMQSHEGRGSGIPQRMAMTTIVPPGDRGRQLAKLELSISGPGRFVDNSEVARTRDGLRIVETNLAKARERLAKSTDEVQKRSLESAVASLEARRTALEKTVAGGATPAARTHLLSYIQLGSDVPADPAVQKAVERIEPPGSAAH